MTVFIGLVAAQKLKTLYCESFAVFFEEKMGAFATKAKLSEQASGL